MRISVLRQTRAVPPGAVATGALQVQNPTWPWADLGGAHQPPPRPLVVPCPIDRP